MSLEPSVVKKFSSFAGSLKMHPFYVKYKGNTIDAHYDSYYNQCKAGYNSITNSIVKFNTIYDDWVTGTMILAYVPDN